MRGALARPEALATVLWLVGENLSYHVAMAAAAPECFRVFVRKFPTLETNVKEEVLRLGCKIWLHLEGKGELVERFRKIFTFALELATYDDYYAIRDQARLFQGALERDSDTFKALKATLLSEKSPPTVSEPHPACSSYELGTFSHLWGHPVGGYEELPAWRVEPPDDSVRIPPGEAALESRPEHIDDFVGRSSRSLSLDEDDSGEEEGSEDDVETSETGGSSTASDESSTESSESSSEEERDSTASGSGRSSAGNRTASASNAAVTAVRGKIMVRFSKTVHSEVTPSPLKSPMQAAPPTFSTPPPDASEQTAAEHAGDLGDDES
ncbi:unnamed protein product [Phytomonas sp. EM1]|nr:unnamed protein product [Phytomonas sp. EM1]|eukprot:CCW63345.1 unnamed protein product [Phytomonas sp. isolate EM1]